MPDRARNGSSESVFVYHKTKQAPTNTETPGVQHKKVVGTIVGRPAVKQNENFRNGPHHNEFWVDSSETKAGLITFISESFISAQ